MYAPFKAVANRTMAAMLAAIFGCTKTMWSMGVMGLALVVVNGIYFWRFVSHSTQIWCSSG